MRVLLLALALVPRCGGAQPDALAPPPAERPQDERTQDERPQDDRPQDEHTTDGIVVTGQRLAEPARPDTVVRITARQLRERGVTNLAQALDLIIDTPVRSSGRKLQQVSIRGARRGGVLLLLDGTPVSEPFYGGFDVTAIPVTGIAEIRVSLNPASPLNGPGGNGGVIEVLTRSALGQPLGRAQIQGSTAPAGHISATGRRTFGQDLGLRLSASGGLDARALPVTTEEGRTTLASDGRQAAAGLRWEHRLEAGRLSADLAATQRKFVIPPGEEAGEGVSVVPDETSFRGVVGLDLRFEEAFVSLRGFALLLDHTVINHTDARLADELTREHIEAHRTGGSAQIDWPVRPDLQLTAVTHLLVEGGRDTLRAPGGGVTAEGRLPIVQPAVGALWQSTEFLTLDGAVGLAVPIGEADPWPEAKLTTTLTPWESLQFRVVGARKGRLPSLRERFSPTQGNPAIDPELGTALEGSVVYEPHDVASLEVSGFWRLTDDLIRIATPGAGGRARVENVGDVTVRGVELRAEVRALEPLVVGGAWAWAEAQSDRLGEDPLDHFPNHRLEAFARLQHRRAGLWSRVRTIGARQDGGAELAAYTTLDASAWARLGPAQLGLRGDNLTNTHYEARAGVPGFGRTLSVTLEGTLE